MRIAIALAVAFVAPLCARAQELPEDLARVPGNAIFFAHVRVDDVLKTPLFKIYRDMLPKAGMEAFKAIEERIVPSPLSIDRVTFVVIEDKRKKRPNEEFAAIIHVSSPLDEKKLIGNLPKEVGADGVVSYRLPREGTLQIFGKNTFLLGSDGAPDALAKGGPLSAEFKEALVLAAARRKTIVAAINMSTLPPNDLKHAPPPIQPILRAKSMIASLDFGKETVLDVDLGFAEPDQAKDAGRTLEDLRQMGKKFLAMGKAEMERKLAAADRVVPIYEIDKVGDVVVPVFALAWIKRGEELLADVPVKQNGKSLNVKLVLPEELSGVSSSAPILVGLLVPAVQKVRESATRLQNANNMKQLGLAMHNYHDNYNRLPSAAICDKDGKPLLSWRVAVLPYVEEQALYNEFKLDEPWDSEHNMKLLPRMPKVFQMPESAQRDRTHYRVPLGPGALFGSPSEKVKLQQIKDGTTNTIMLVETEESVPWTKPEEFAFGPGALPKLYRRPGHLVTLCDSAVLTLPATMREAALRALFTRDGGERVDPWGD